MKNVAGCKLQVAGCKLKATGTNIFSWQVAAFALIFLSSIFCSSIYAQDESVLRKNSWNIGIWTGGGSGVNGRTKDTHLWLTGAHFGKVLSSEKGHGTMRGKLEYSLEVIPAFMVFQDSTVYGFDVTPLLFRWNFSGSKKWIPYFEIGAGMLLTTDDVPERTFPVNFTPQA